MTLSEPSTLKAVHWYCPALPNVSFLAMRRDPPAISLITNRPVEDTWRSFQRQFITGEGVPLARQSIDTSEPDNTCKRSPIWMLTSPWPSMDFTELFPDWISAPLLPKQKNGIVSHFGSSLAYIRDRNVFAQPMDTVFGYLMDIGYWILINLARMPFDLQRQTESLGWTK